MDNKELLNKKNNQSKNEILKSEWFSFFWKRAFISLIVGVLLGLLLKQDSSSYQLLTSIAGYLISSYLIMGMINGEKSKLILKNSNNTLKTNYTETLKMYWSFYWREFIYGLFLGVFIVFMSFVVVALGKLSSGLLVFLIFLLGISVIIASYYIGRHVFIEVVEKVNWSGKTLDVKK